MAEIQVTTTSMAYVRDAYVCICLMFIVCLCIYDRVLNAYLKYDDMITSVEKVIALLRGI